MRLQCKVEGGCPQIVHCHEALWALWYGGWANKQSELEYVLRVEITADNVKDGLNWEVVGDCLGGNRKWSCTLSLYFMYFFCYKAGKKTTDEELEEMLESGNPAIFTSGVSDQGTHFSAQG